MQAPPCPDAFYAAACGGPACVMVARTLCPCRPRSFVTLRLPNTTALGEAVELCELQVGLKTDPRTSSRERRGAAVPGGVADNFDAVGSLTGGAFAGLAIGAVVGAALLLLAVAIYMDFFFRWRRRRQQKRRASSEASASLSAGRLGSGGGGGSKEGSRSSAIEAVAAGATSPFATGPQAAAVLAAPGGRLRRLWARLRGRGGNDSQDGSLSHRAGGAGRSWVQRAGFRTDAGPSGGVDLQAVCTDLTKLPPGFLEGLPGCLPR